MEHPIVISQLVRSSIAVVVSTDGQADITGRNSLQKGFVPMPNELVVMMVQLMICRAEKVWERSLLYRNITILYNLCSLFHMIPQFFIRRGRKQRRLHTQNFSGGTNNGLTAMVGAAAVIV